MGEAFLEMKPSPQHFSFVFQANESPYNQYTQYDPSPSSHTIRPFHQQTKQILSLERFERR